MQAEARLDKETIEEILPKISEERLSVWRSKVPRLKHRLQTLLKCKELARPAGDSDHTELSLPDDLMETIDAEQEVSYDTTKKVEVFVLQQVAPLIEGSTLGTDALLEQVTQIANRVKMPENLRLSIKVPSELLSACFTKQSNLPGKLWKALTSMDGVDASAFPQYSWRVNHLEMLEPAFKPTEVKASRQKRRTFISKVEILVWLVSSLEKDPVDKELSEEELDK